MNPLAKLWTWTGQSFIPLAIAWAVYVRNGLLAEKPPTEGAIISRAYWGLLITLAAGTVLSWTLALYARAAKEKHSNILIPANTSFESETNRNRVISWATVCVFGIATTLALVVFGVRYAESMIYTWDAQSPLAQGFWASRVRAYELGCASQPCFAVGQRFDANGPIYGVNEYILYVTDGAIAVLAVLLLLGILFLFKAVRQKSKLDYE